MLYDFNDSEAIDILEESIKAIRRDNRDVLLDGGHLEALHILNRAKMHLASSGDSLAGWFEPATVE